jgi:hypothetical protein
VRVITAINIAHTEAAILELASGLKIIYEKYGKKKRVSGCSCIMGGSIMHSNQGPIGSNRVSRLGLWDVREGDYGTEKRAVVAPALWKEEVLFCFIKPYILQSLSL